MTLKLSQIPQLWMRIAEDAAGACFGEECCDDKPIPEVAEMLKHMNESKGVSTTETQSRGENL
jgi:hypothetical protein